MNPVHRLPAWGDKEISRFKYRVGLFTRRGLDTPQAEDLADRLFERDHERDERRVCVECAHLQRGGSCFKASQGAMPYADKKWNPVPTLLQRCEQFAWQVPA